MLVAVPLVNQLADGDVNARADCASAATAAGLMALIPGLRLTGGSLKDAAYGVAYRGPTDVLRYIPQALADGVRLWNVTGDGASLVQVVIRELQQGHPVLGAIPSLWGNAWPGGAAMVTFDQTYPDQGTHEVAFCDYDATHGTLTAMNPWPEPPTNNAFYQTMPVAWWAARLVYGRVDPLALAHAGAPPMTIAPVWHPENGTLVYLAHDSLPPITLDHGQAYYAHTSGTRLGCYPLAPARQEGDDSVVYWSDGQRSRAVKAAKWAITLEPAGPGLARLLAERDALAVEDAGRGQQIAALQQRLADAQGAAQSSATLQASLNAANANVAALTQQVRDLEAKLAASPVTLDGAVHSQVAALVVAIGQMDAVVRAVAGALSVPVLAQTLPQLVAAMDRLDALAGALQARMAASGPESLVGPSDAAPVPATDLHSQAA